MQTHFQVLAYKNPSSCNTLSYVRDLLVPPPASSNWSIRFKRNKTLPIFNVNIILMMCNGPKMTYIETAPSEYKNAYD